jgi:hypothetical protein
VTPQVVPAEAVFSSRANIFALRVKKSTSAMLLAKSAARLDR